MATAPRRLNVGDVASAGRSLRASADVHAAGSAGLELANELLSRSAVSLDVAEHALERLRYNSRASEAHFWLLTDATARCVLRVGDHALDQPLPIIHLDNRRDFGERLRRRAAVLCRAGEVTGVEELLPGSPSSYAVLSCGSDAEAIGVLALGWNAARPPLDGTSIAHLQLAAGALLRTLPSRGAVAPTTANLDDGLGDESGTQLFEGVIDALPMPIWIHDENGGVIDGNARWKNALHAAPAEDGRPVWTDFFHPVDRALVIDAFEAAFARQSTVSIEVRVADSSGAYQLATCHLSPYTDRHQRVRGYVCSCSDISAQRHAEHALGAMGSRLIAAQEEERSRIARELHDDLGQQAALLASKIEMLLRSSKANVLSLRNGITEAKQNVNDLAVSIHNLSHQLHPPKLKLLGLVKTLEALCRNVSKESGVQVSFRTTPIPTAIPERVALCVCRVAQEALQNAIKHSGARQIGLSLTASESELTLRVADAGCGFDPVLSAGSGIGLLSMRERVELNAGRLLIDASPGAGTTIEATVPIELPY